MSNATDPDAAYRRDRRNATCRTAIFVHALAGEALRMGALCGEAEFAQVTADGLHGLAERLLGAARLSETDATAWRRAIDAEYRRLIEMDVGAPPCPPA